jgi:multiple sugar transport system permease protein
MSVHNTTPTQNRVGGIKRKQTKASLKQRLKIQLQWYSFILPTIICLIVLTYIPLIQCIRYSLYKVNVIGFGESYIGIKNYVSLLTGSGFPRALRNTLLLSVYSLVVIPLGFILASVLHTLGRNKTQSFFRVMFYMPNIITGVSVVLMFRYVLMQDGGLLNKTLSILFGQEINIPWLSDPKFTKFGVTIMYCWTAIGYNMLICLAGLQAIPTEIYEAASIDGCNAWQTWTNIKIPSIISTFAFLLITNIIGSFSRFTDLFLFSGNSASGKPGYSLQTLLMYIYQYSFESPNYGVASAGSMILFVIILFITIFNLRLTGFYRKDQ